MMSTTGACIALVAAATLGWASNAVAGPREQAQRIHDRLTGVPPSDAMLDQMEALITSGDALGAALLATHDPRFYTVTLKNMAAPWTNRDQSPFVPLNDYTTLVIGLVADDEPFDQILYGDLLYYAPSVSPAPSASSNAHYEALEQAMLEEDFDPETDLQQTTQSSIYPLPPDATAGAITTRAAAEAFFIAGTNRAMFRFTLINHMCMDLEQVQDTSIIPDRIRQDVSRSPGGDSRVFMNSCVGCHAGMDPLAQAFAYYDFDPVAGSIEYTEGTVQPKYFNNELTFPDGFVTPDDSWDNYWREGRNALLGWDPSLPGSGNGAKSLGMEIARSEAFAQCQVEKVFRAVCLRDPVDASDRAKIDTMAADFANNNYQLRDVFAESAVYCMGD
ncbi:MAG TPA: hypothetical protein VF329_01595 [Gammaproteobacteria bacterium]